MALREVRELVGDWWWWIGRVLVNRVANCSESNEMGLRGSPGEFSWQFG